MSAAVLEHPAVAIASGVVHDLDSATSPIAVAARDEIAAVLLESSDHRFVVFVPYAGGKWVAPGMTSGTRRPVREPQEPRTGDVPLVGVSERGFVTPGPDGQLPEFAWFAVIGYAAADALEVTLTSSMDTVTEPVGDGGLVFVLVRTRVVAPSAGEPPSFEKPQIAIHTQDGRRVSMRP